MGRWRQVADRLGRYGFIALFAGVILALVGGFVQALNLIPSAKKLRPEMNECVNPPCFDLDMPGVSDLPLVLPVLFYLAAILLGLPSLLVGAIAFFRGNTSRGARMLLIFLGPLLVFVGMETIPHLLNPCLIAEAMDSRTLPGFCERNEYGVDFKGQWHLLDHTLVGAIPMTALYWLALRRWRPDLVGSLKN